MAGGALKIRYTGAAASCLLTADATAKTLTSEIGAAGAEVADAAFGTVGVIDLTAATFDTLDELAAAIDGYADYTCEVFYGDDIATENILDAILQAKTAPAYVLFSIASILSADALVSWEYLKAVLVLLDSEQEATERLINAASAQANRYTGRLLRARDHTKILDGTADFYLVLPDYPVNSISSLRIDSLRTFAAASEVTDYLYYDDGRLYYAGKFPLTPQSVKVLWNGGYELADVPEEIKMAITEIVQWYRSRLVSQGIGVAFIQNPDGIVTRYETDFPESAKAKLGPYRRIQ